MICKCIALLLAMTAAAPASAAILDTAPSHNRGITMFISDDPADVAIFGGRSLAVDINNDGDIRDTLNRYFGPALIPGEIVYVQADRTGAPGAYDYLFRPFIPLSQRLPGGPFGDQGPWVGADDIPAGARIAFLAPVPLPAAAWMLLAGLGGLGALRFARRA
jgi:hypothetical protein